jgi:hypothetical protein
MFMAYNVYKDVLGGFNVFAACISVALVMALIPAIKGFITSASGNLTATELAISALVPLVLILALAYSVANETGMLKKK